MHNDIAQQPQALRDLIAFYDQAAGAARLAKLPAGTTPIITGMGASFHAAQAMLPYFHSLDIPAIAIESIDLLNYSQALLKGHALIFVSQSGSSAEIPAILAELPADAIVLGVTNTPESVLGQRAQVVLPTIAGAEAGVATKTYINSLAALWLLARGLGGALDGSESTTLGRVADASERLLAESDAIAARWLGELDTAEQLVFVGHGPHIASARQASLMLAERARVAATGMGVGAFRHGPIEIAQAGLGAVIFAPAGRTSESALTLAKDLHGYGARVLIVEHGNTRSLDEPASSVAEIDEFLSPLLDVIPAQLFADALARRRGVGPGFRYIGKVVTRL